MCLQQGRSEDSVRELEVEGIVFFFQISIILSLLTSK